MCKNGYHIYMPKYELLYKAKIVINLNELKKNESWNR